MANKFVIGEDGERRRADEIPPAETAAPADVAPSGDSEPASEAPAQPSTTAKRKTK